MCIKLYELFEYHFIEYQLDVSAFIFINNCKNFMEGVSTHLQVAEIYFCLTRRLGLESLAYSWLLAMAYLQKNSALNKQPNCLNFILIFLWMENPGSTPKASQIVHSFTDGPKRLISPCLKFRPLSEWLLKFFLASQRTTHKRA